MDLKASWLRPTSGSFGLPPVTTAVSQAARFEKSAAVANAHYRHRVCVRCNQSIRTWSSTVQATDEEFRTNFLSAGASSNYSKLSTEDISGRTSSGHPRLVRPGLLPVGESCLDRCSSRGCFYISSKSSNSSSPPCKSLRRF